MSEETKKTAADPFAEAAELPRDDLQEGEVAAPDGAAAEDPRIAELNDRLLRSLAEMENLRERTRRDIDEARRYAVTGFARELLDVADNLRRALAVVPEEARGKDSMLDNLYAGIEMTERSLLTVFERHQVRKVVPERGERFDHKLHQAMYEVPTDELPPGTVAELMAPGYVIADRLLRPAMVGVAKAAAPAGNGQA